MKNLLFVSHNKNKLIEIQSLLPTEFNLKNLDDVGIYNDIPENELTFEGNAKSKVEYVRKKIDTNCFADDSGLEIHELNNEPGVFSARYAGLEKDNDANLNLVLKNLQNKINRNANFTTVICLFWKNKYHFFEGKVFGKITTSRKGENGFGYDSIFIPNGSTKTFGEMLLNEKNKFSHRAIALHKMIQFLEK